MAATCRATQRPDSATRFAVGQTPKGRKQLAGEHGSVSELMMSQRHDSYYANCGLSRIFV